MTELNEPIAASSGSAAAAQESFGKAALEEAIEILGGPSAASRTLNVSREALRRWLEGINQLLPERALEIEAATRAAGKVVVCERLCPNVDWIRDEVGCVTHYQVRVEAPKAAA